MIKNREQKNEWGKAISFVLAGLLLWPGLGQAFFSGDATSTDNDFSAGTLEIGLSDSSLATTLYENATSSVNVAVSDAGSVAAQYELSQQKETCTDDFYAGLNVVLDASGTELYSGDLSSLNATSSADTWNFDITAKNSMIMSLGETCSIDFTVSSWQTQFATSTAGGFSDTAHFTLVITAGDDVGVTPATATVVLNEIYPATLATTTEPLDREWVELYNGTAAAVDVAGWVISELSGGSATEHKYEIASTCPSTTPSKYVHPWNGTDTLISPGGLLVLEFCGGANYLNDGGDTVSLYTSTSTVSAIDSHAYPSTVNGKSHARIPDGGTWIDPIPTPGQPNVATAEDMFGFASNTTVGDTGTATSSNEAEVASSTASSTLTFDIATSTEPGVSTSTNPDEVVDDGIVTATSTDATKTATSTEQADTEEDADPGVLDPENNNEVIEGESDIIPEAKEPDEEGVSDDGTDISSEDPEEETASDGSNVDETPEPTEEVVSGSQEEPASNSVDTNENSL